MIVLIIIITQMIEKEFSFKNVEKDKFSFSTELMYVYISYIFNDLLPFVTYVQFLKLTGRIKEQFKIENGKYIVPAPLEVRKEKRK